MNYWGLRLMPLVKIEIYEGKSSEYKNAILNGVHQALVQVLAIPESDRFQRLYELRASEFETPPDRSDQATIIEITMFKGRSSDIKKELFKTIIKNLSRNPGIDGYDIVIILLEPPLENWGVRGGKPASEIDFDFKIDI